MSEKLLVIAVVALLFSGAAFAQGPPLSMEAIDTDKSGHISQEEAQAHPVLIRKWTLIDTNGDGQIDAAEFAGFAEVTPVPAEGQ